MANKRRRNKQQQNRLEREQASKFRKLTLTETHLLQCTRDIIEKEQVSLLLNHDTYPRAQYYSREYELKSTLHWGQRKLFLSEMYLLIQYMKSYNINNNEQYTVLYAGAAPGTHLGYLSELFPQFNFILVDPNEFRVNTVKNITVRQEYFTDALAEEWKDKVDIFFSDIRTGNWTIMSDEENEQCILKDMAAQKKWTEIIRPKIAMLKFRLPYADGKTEYINGDILLPIFAPQTTTETRLIVNHDQIDQKKVYDHRTYWEQLFYFNTVDRVCYYPHKVNALGIDHCFDCSAEVWILREYIVNILKTSDITEEEILENISTMSNEISIHISPSGRTLLDFPAKHEYEPKYYRMDVSDAQIETIVVIDNLSSNGSCSGTNN
jgi:hypothetical protein